MSGKPVALTLRGLGLGDLLTALPAMRALGRAFPGHRHLLACPGWLAPLVDWAGVVDEVVDVPGLAPIPVSAPELAVNLHGRGPESHRLLLATRPGRLIAFRHEAVPESWSGPRWREDEHEVHRWCRLLRESDIATDPGALGLRRAGLPIPAPAVGATLVHPGAAFAARRWPPERWGRVARALHRVGEPVVVTAGPGERPLAEAVIESAGLPPSALLEPGDVLVLAGAVAGARRVLVSDTGVAHLATAVGTPQVVLFGPEPPARWGPPAAHPHVALWAGWYGDPRGGTPDPGLLEIGPEDVVRALRELPA